MERFKITREDFIQLLQYLLQQGIVDSVLSGKEKGNHYTLEPNFVTDPNELTEFPLSQLSVYGFARTDSPANSIMHSHKALTEKVAVIGHACDIRALVELNKKMQVVWSNLFLIAFEDTGYLEVTPLMKYFKQTGFDATQLIGERLTNTQLRLSLSDETSQIIDLGEKLNISDNCTRCIQKSHPMADFIISTYTLPIESEEYILSPQTDRAKDIVGKLNLTSKKVSEDINQAYEALATSIVEKCAQKRESDLDAFIASEDKLVRIAKCTGCGLCVKACPVCYCPECSLTTQIKAKKMDKLTFVMTRFAHIGDICVECGKCNSNCPSQVPLSLIFQELRRKFKARYKYDAGSNLQTKVLHLDI